MQYQCNEGGSAPSSSRIAPASYPKRRIAVRGSVTYFAVHRETHGMAAYGIVSRVTPVHTAVRNCTRDEGRSFEVGNQGLISSHRKLLLSKAMVVNVAEKSERDFGRYD